MDKKLLDILACPNCKGKLIYRPKVGELVCKQDRLIFHIRDGIPVMLLEEATEIPADVEIED
ncbi:Trm112 family protein [Thiosocius teredinicola]|uniref:Trm112 family protein n=1 Tax=Thiosocius teredinicola TaxID=1973002 RepID=UPI0009910E51